MKILNLLILTIAVLMIQACNMVNPKESIPTYIQIDSVKVVSTDLEAHGSTSHKITDIWAYFDRQLLGAFQLPAKIPVIANKRGQMQFVAGIYEDGLSGIRAKYPFYTVDTFTFTPSPAGIINYVPKFYYRTGDSQSTTYFIEDFEQGNSFEGGQGDTSFVKTNLPGEVFEGNWSCKMELSDSIKFGESISVQEFSLPVGKMCYLELNYKSDIPFVLRTQIKVGGITSNIDLTGIKPTSSWGKIYYNFGGFPNTYQSTTFKFLFDAILPVGLSHGKILIDNFKIIHFK